jgi:hypothetical protein
MTGSEAKGQQEDKIYRKYPHRRAHFGHGTAVTHFAGSRGRSQVVLSGLFELERLGLPSNGLTAVLKL